jgi:hypothetical protein
MNKRAYEIMNQETKEMNDDMDEASTGMGKPRSRLCEEAAQELELANTYIHQQKNGNHLSWWQGMWRCTLPIYESVMVGHDNQ